MAKVHSDCINASNHYHECVDYCYAKIGEAKDRTAAEKLESEEEIVTKLAERTVHLDCINASNPYHECSEYCFIKMVEAKEKNEREKLEENNERTVKELEDREAKRKSFSRRRKFHEEKDIDSIKDMNEHFNKKIERAYGKYTLEIKNNLERGTALPD